MYETTLFYRAGRWDAEAQGGYSGSDKWETHAEAGYQWRQGEAVWSVALGGLVERDDDLQFFGFGARPREDGRNPFLADVAARQGTYFQRREQLRLGLVFQPATQWAWMFSSFYQKRAVEDPLRERDGLGKVFDLERLPGAQQPTEQWYTELSAVLDTRPSPERIVPGMRLEGYAGLAEGVRGDPSRSWRAGADLAFFVPVIQTTRILVPRLVVDQVENLDDGIPLAFTEFPRHPLFRGVSARKLLRTDNWSLLSSLEYQWPVAPTLGGHLFVDYLLVADEPAGFSPGGGAWAVGWGLDLHTEERGLAGVEVATGSQGFRFLLTAGFSGDSDERSRQK